MVEKIECRIPDEGYEIASICDCQQCWLRREEELDRIWDYREDD